MVPAAATTGRFSICWVRSFGGPASTKSRRFPAHRDLRDPQAVVEHVHRLTELADAHPAVREPRAVGRDAHFGGPELESRPRPHLGSFGAGEDPEDLFHGPLGYLQDRLEVRSH